MLTPEKEAFLRTWCEYYQSTDKGKISADDGMLMLGEIDRLRLIIKSQTLALGGEPCHLCQGGGLLPEDGRACPRCLEPQLTTQTLSSFGLGDK